MEPALGYFSEDGEEEITEMDLSRPAQSAIEYLRRVQQETAMCDEVVVADIKGRHAFQQKQTVGVNQSNYKMQPCPADYIYPVNWQLQQTANFAKIRQSYIKRHKASERHKTKSKVAFPVSMTLDHWCKFCFGTEFFERYAKMIAPDVSREQATERKQGNPPLVSFISEISQPKAIQLLEMHIEWLDKLGLSPEQGQWLFSLLICLDKPTPPEAVSLLRVLARKCALIRAGLPSKADSLLPHLNLLIALVSRYFGQRDLSD